MNVKVKQNQRCARESDCNINDSEPHLIFLPVCLLAINQTDGEPIPDLDQVPGEPALFLERLKRFFSGGTNV